MIITICKSIVTTQVFWSTEVLMTQVDSSREIKQRQEYVFGASCFSSPSGFTCGKKIHVCVGTRTNSVCAFDFALPAASQ